jgi:site-specific DNA-methyltransferase (adenine-specific)
MFSIKGGFYIGELIYKTDNCDLWQGDCLSVMKAIPDNSIDMVLCDLPYGTTKCKWDVIIPFEPLWEQYERIIKDDAAIVLFGSEPFSSYLRLSNINIYKYDLIWEKNNGAGFLDCNVRPIKYHEEIMIFSKYGCSNGAKRKMKYYPQDLVYVNKNNNRGNSRILNAVRNGCVKTVYTNYPKTILKFSKDKQIHPTQKPVALCEYLIRTYSLEDETILDNCMGSGSTGVAALNTNRRFIGIEQDAAYCSIAKERIQHVVDNIS